MAKASFRAMEYLLPVGIFLSKVTILVVAFIVVVVFLAAIIQRSRMKPQLEVTNWNENYDYLKETLNSVIQDKKEFKKTLKELKKKAKERKKRVFVIDFDGDMRASQVESLRHEISSILAVANSSDEVVVRLESPGGMVSPYGLAASQLARLREANIPLTVCVDQVAASGGYLMACVANKVVAAPFAVVGSIGVVASVM